MVNLELDSYESTTAFTVDPEHPLSQIDELTAYGKRKKRSKILTFPVQRKSNEKTKDSSETTVNVTQTPASTPPELLRFPSEPGEDEADTITIPETILLTKVLDLFNREKVNTIDLFLVKLDEIIKYAQEQKIQIKLTALKVRPGWSEVVEKAGTSVIQKKAFSDKEVAEFTIEDFIRLREGIAREWARLLVFKEYPVPAKNLIGLIKVCLQQIQPEHIISPYDIQDIYDIQDVEDANLTLKNRLYEIMRSEFQLTPETEKTQ